MTIDGGCLCGRVRYRIEGRLFNAGHCHCSMCRKQHGAAFSTYAQCNPEEFKWTTGASLVKTYETSPGNGWCFCTACGSSLAGTENGRITWITLGSVDGDPGTRPATHEFVGSKGCWHEITDTLPQHDTWMPTPKRI